MRSDTKGSFERQPGASWLGDVLDLQRLRAEDGILVAKDLPRDKIASTDEGYHDRESVRYDDYLQEEPVASTEGWVVPRLVEMLGAGVVADVGCGTGRVAERLIRSGRRVVAIDHSVGMLRKTVERGDPEMLTAVRADARDLPLKSGSCDAVLCSGVLHHVPDWPLVLEEVSRVLRPGGRATIREPNADYAEGIFTPIENLLAAPNAIQERWSNREHHDDRTGVEERVYERHFSERELVGALPARLKTDFATSTMLFGSLWLEPWFPLRARYYKVASLVDSWLFDHRFRVRGGALLVALTTRQ